MKKVVVLDFDGVVWDSVDEAFEMAWRAWGDLKAPKAALRQMFRDARWQATDGRDFYVVMQALAEDPPRDLSGLPVAEFAKLREAARQSSEADAFVRRFYAHRARMRDEDFAGWMALQGPYPGIAEQIERLRDGALGVAIATTKDAPSAVRLLETIGIHGLTIYGREVSLDKADHMRAVQRQFGVPPQQIVFADDLLENLLPLAPMGIRPVLPDWGYNTPAERARARTFGVVVISLPTMAEHILGL